MKKINYKGYAAFICIAALMSSLSACSSKNTTETTAAESSSVAETESSSAETSAETADAPYADESSAGKRGEEPITVEPIVNHLSVDGSMDATFSASFTPASDITKDGDSYTLSFDAYYEQYYEAAIIAMLKAGDSIVIGSDTVLIDSIEDNGGIYMINGGLDEGGYDLITDGNDMYYERGYDDYRSYGELGHSKLPIADDCAITDNSDLDHQDKKLTIEELAANDDYVGFLESNTVITVEDGKITEITRSYRP